MTFLWVLQDLGAFHVGFEAPAQCQLFSFKLCSPLMCNRDGH